MNQTKTISTTNGKRIEIIISCARRSKLGTLGMSISTVSMNFEIYWKILRNSGGSFRLGRFIAAPTLCA
jgi:hypothetical protein